MRNKIASSLESELNILIQQMSTRREKGTFINERRDIRSLTGRVDRSERNVNNIHHSNAFLPEAYRVGGRKSLGYLELGNRLELDAKIEILYGKKILWPIQVCRNLRGECPSEHISEISYNLSSTQQNDLENYSQIGSTTTTSNNKRLTSCNHLSGLTQNDDPLIWLDFDWIRPAVIILQSAFAGITLLLSILLLRLRRSRVSRFLSPSLYITNRIKSKGIQRN